ncbi:MAG TPA: polyamine ABC transporter substrate-binding protein [Aliidongia sp.]|uniref:polyamine ABC transporter substrate-binding protein n=1 Tax=Aliidongia sp. TaxID=1914230 RepID=UPI002DDDBA61|nr:polyamine ABC transporter substrate-binding protein [Aliidongia sp.]HEV2674829.1 polyamine ABC transporter substrate-binding protein [Aliidongia sp.]
MRQVLLATVAVAAFGIVAMAGPARAEDGKVLNIYNWSDYIGTDTIANFEKATGIKVSYDTYDANETLDGKLKAGHSGYDLVVPSLTPFLAEQIQSGIYQPLDKSKLPNWSHLDQGLLKRMAVYDKDNAHAIPWVTGTTGIGVVMEKVKAIMPDAPVDSLKFFFDPAILSKFKGCGVTMLDTPNDVFPAVLHYLGLNPDSQKKEDLEKAADVLMKIRPYIRKFDSSEYINDLVNGDVCVSWGYSSDVTLAKRRATEAGKGVTVVYNIPIEGSQRYIDTMAMPKDAPHPDAALKFLNYILQPEVMAETSNTIYGQSGNADAIKFVKPEIASNPGIFPPAEVEAKLFLVSVSTKEIERLKTRLWTKIKSGH